MPCVQAVARDWLPWRGSGLTKPIPAEVRSKLGSEMVAACQDPYGSSLSLVDPAVTDIDTEWMAQRAGKGQGKDMNMDRVTLQALLIVTGSLLLLLVVVVRARVRGRGLRNVGYSAIASPPPFRTDSIFVYISNSTEVVGGPVAVSDGTVASAAREYQSI